MLVLYHIESNIKKKRAYYDELITTKQKECNEEEARYMSIKRKVAKVLENIIQIQNIMRDDSEEKTQVIQ